VFRRRTAGQRSRFVMYPRICAQVCANKVCTRVGPMQDQMTSIVERSLTVEDSWADMGRLIEQASSLVSELSLL